MVALIVKSVKKYVIGSVQASKRRYCQTNLYKMSETQEACAIFGGNKPLCHIPKLVTHVGTFTGSLDSRINIQ